jgi:hypothetical protein
MLKKVTGIAPGKWIISRTSHIISKMDKQFNSFSPYSIMEPLFDPSSKTLGERYTLFPIDPSEEDLYKLYKKAVASFWPAEEIDFS